MRPEGRLQVLRGPGGVHQGARPQLQQVPGDAGGVHPPEELPGGCTHTVPHTVNKVSCEASFFEHFSSEIIADQITVGPAEFVLVAAWCLECFKDES